MPGDRRDPCAVLALLTRNLETKCVLAMWRRWPMAQHHVQVLVSRENFFKNIQYLRRLVAPSQVCVVMKANAYGHGLAVLAPVAVEAGADMIGICTNPEAETIRKLGLDIPLLRLRMALPQELEESVNELG